MVTKGLYNSVRSEERGGGGEVYNSIKQVYNSDQKEGGGGERRLEKQLL